MKMMYLILKIWVVVCREDDEMGYDDHMDKFEEVIDLTRQAAEAEGKKQRSPSEPTVRPKFVLEMGFIPVLYFVVTKCRKLSLRLAALKYLPVVAPERENLWNATIMCAVARKIVEMEHGPLGEDGQLLLAPGGIEASSVSDISPEPEILRGDSPDRAHTPPSLLSKPPSEHRIKDALVLSQRNHGGGVTTVPAYASAAQGPSSRASELYTQQVRAILDKPSA